MELKTLPSESGEHNLANYDETVKSFDWKDVENVFSWSVTGKVNVAYEAIDRHVEGKRKNKVALIYRGTDGIKNFTFMEVKDFSNQVGNVFRDFGVRKGERVAIFLPRIPELYFSIIGAIKLGAIAVPLLASFNETGLHERLLDCEAKYLVTTSGMLHRVPIAILPNLQTIFVLGENIEESEKIINLKKRLSEASNQLEIEWVDHEDGLLLHYTSGSTGKPKGVLHVHHAMIQHYITSKWVLDLKEDDIYWCTADPGWITGTAYGIFGPWLNGTTTVVVGGRFSPESWYQTIEELGVTVWYSVPTSFRMLMGAGEEVAKRYKLSSLRHILSVGEPLNKEVILWGNKVFGKRIHDTWWMTETGAQMICNYPSMDIRPGSMGKPIPGVEAAIVDHQGNKLPPYKVGNLAVKKDWPAMMRAIWNSPEKYQSYFLPNGWFITGDSAYVDEDGYFWFKSRVDDVIITSGVRVGPFEVESSLIEHPAVKEAGVLGVPDPIHGEVIKAYVSLRDGYVQSEELKEEIQLFVRNRLASHTVPKMIEFVDELPKTKSGKIMRRVLRSWGKTSKVGY